ncbi:heterokaryon incompatibility protein-domain-containing protein [Diplogelasinospora grovesii]|uniref:Heterokaryon incompatibility protein-domain-containing protein n=1 Tax=Diplogelasinospora grovesii TaxID=303347 RepID=A0AAN6NHQ8_9PEZI|nr:heterokaryon incompatibility protein-domain-containing protein [Diplogelasinospora grovesii]
MPSKYEYAWYRFPERGPTDSSPLLILLRWSWAGPLGAIVTDFLFPESLFLVAVSFLVGNLLRPAGLLGLIKWILECTHGHSLRPSERGRSLRALGNAAAYWMAMFRLRIVRFIDYLLHVENLPEFSYQAVPLPDARHFRILKLETRRLQTTTIEARLIPVPISCPRKYRCISYVWGQDKATPHVIRLNNRRFRVTSNVYRILLSQSCMWGANYIWIDSVYINQEDRGDEKTYQVRMMKDIYSRADKVVIWLGEPENPARERQVDHASSEWLSLATIRFPSGRLGPSAGRAAVVQELASARSADILYGGYQLPWLLLLNDLAFVHRSELKDVFSIFQGSLVPGMPTPVKDPPAPRNAFSMDSLREALSHGDYPPLPTVLTEFLSWKATHGVDKIFALLPLTDAACALQDLIDYKKPIREVLIGVSIHCLLGNRDLAFLNFAGTGWGDVGRDPAHAADLPSWVVDWTVSRTPASLAVRMGGEKAALYNAAHLAMPGFFKVSPGLDRISLKGIRIDVIQRVGQAETFKSSLDVLDISGVDQTIAWLEDYDRFIVQRASDPYISRQSLSEVKSRLLIGDRTATARPAPETYRDYFDRLLSAERAVRNFIARHHGESISAAADTTTTDATLMEFAQIMETRRAVVGRLHEAPVIFGEASFPRRVCVTEKGYLSAVPVHSKPGDVLVAILGTSVPFVLRPAGTAAAEDGEDEEGPIRQDAPPRPPPPNHKLCYQLVGECYCHGMMDQEALELQGCGPESFTLI